MDLSQIPSSTHSICTTNQELVFWVDFLCWASRVGGLGSRFCASAVYAVVTGSDCGVLHHSLTPRTKSMLSLKSLMFLWRDVSSSPDSSIAAPDLVRHTSTWGGCSKHYSKMMASVGQAGYALLQVLLAWCRDGLFTAHSWIFPNFHSSGWEL